MLSINTLFPYSIDEKFAKSTAYFSMEFAIDQALKIYSGGLGFLAGSHMRSAYTLKQNLIGIGILWKYGYYDQQRNEDGTLKVSYLKKEYLFLTDTKIVFPITIHNHTVRVKVYLLKPEVYHTAPIFFLSTDIPENDYLTQTICHRLYDSHESARIAQSILLGVGGAKLLDILGRKTDIYHMNEGHALPLCFYLLDKYKKLEEVKKRVVFTTHTPEKAGNEEHLIKTLEVTGFFQGASQESILSLAAPDTKKFNYTLAALRMAKRANGVSQLHGEVSKKMWGGYDKLCSITAITNAQNKSYWTDRKIRSACKKNDDQALVKRKKELKKELFRIVADQTGKLYDPNVLTLVWARRFASYKRANLLLSNFDRFQQLVTNQKFPIQILWAGKPYPEDHNSIAIFNDIFWKTKPFPNCTILTGYELWLSAQLKKGSDAWLNNPRMYHEASGTSGMTAAMNGSINISLPDGWVPEFAEHNKNAFIIEKADDSLSLEERDKREVENLFNLLEQLVIPTYYQHPDQWNKIVKTAMRDIVPFFDSDRMAREYYEQMYLPD